MINKQDEDSVEDLDIAKLMDGCNSIGKFEYYDSSFDLTIWHSNENASAEHNDDLDQLEINQIDEI